MRIYMQTFEFVAMPRQRIEERLLIEAVRHAEVLFFTRQGMQIAEYLSHAAVLGSKHALHVVITQRTGPDFYPPGHFLDYIEGLRVARVQVHVEQARHDFVDSVEGRPHRDALPQTIEQLLRKRTEIAILIRQLAAGQLGHQRVAFALEIFIAGARIHERHCREIVSAVEMPTQLTVRFLPAAEWSYRRGQGRSYFERVH